MTEKEKSDFIVEHNHSQVRLMLSKIDEMLKKDLSKEKYEDCARFNKFLRNEIPFEEIKEDLSFAGDKLNGLIDDAITKSKKNKK